MVLADTWSHACDAANTVSCSTQGQQFKCKGSKGGKDDGPTYSVPKDCSTSPVYPTYILGTVGCQGHNLCAQVRVPATSRS